MLHVVCFGNLWQGDDGFGTHVFQRLCRMRLPAHVKAFDAGTAGLSALDYFEDCRRVVIVDAIRTGGPQGSVRRFSLEDCQCPDSEFSVHALGVDHLLNVLPVVFEGRTMPDVVVIGAEISGIEPFTDKLTPALAAAVDTVTELLESEYLN